MQLDPTPTPTPAATPLPDLKLNAVGGSVRASGNIEPAQKAELAFADVGRGTGRGGRSRRAGHTRTTRSIALEAADAEAAVEQARSALFQAQAKLEDISEWRAREEIEMAQAKLDGAEARWHNLPRAPARRGGRGRV